MSTVPILNIGLLGMQRAMNDALRNSGKIAAATRHETLRPVELATPLTRLLQDRQQIQAAAEVVKSVDETLGTLLDVMA